MARLLRYPQTWAIRAFLAIACVHVAADWSLAQQTIFNESVLKKWREYEDFSRSIQAKARITISAPEAGTARSHHAIYKQNRQCSMKCNDTEGGEPIYEFCMISNARYSAEIKRNVSDHSNTLLLDYQEDPNAHLGHKVLSLFDTMFAGASPHFTYRSVRLSEVVFRPSFKVNGVSKEMRDGEQLIRVDHSYVYDIPNPKVKRQYRIRGSIYFDPARCWCIRQIKESEEFFQSGPLPREAEVEVRNEVTDHPSGFPIIKSHSLFRTGGGTLTRDYETEINENVPNDEFTLTAFGLPEPVGMEPVKKPIPLYVWILAAAGACGVIALVFRHLARYRRLAAAS